MHSHDEILAEMMRQIKAGSFKQKEIAAALNIAPPRVNEMIKGGRRIQPHEMAPLAALLGMDSNSSVPEGAEPIVPIPLLGDVPGGPWREAIRKSHHFIPAPQAGMPASAYALKVRGDSMDRVAKDGATIIIDPTDFDLFERRLFVVRNGDGEVTFKQYREGPARLVPCSTNDQHKEMPITDKDYEIVGRVIKIILDPDQAALD